MNNNQLSVIHPNAKIGKNVIIEPFSTIEKDTVIGDGCWIGPNTVICEGARLGKNVKVYSGASISAIPQDLKFAGEKTETFIGDNTVIREFVTISRGTIQGKKTVVGKNCLLMAYVHVAHDCKLGDHCIIVNATQMGGHVEIDDWAVIGGCTAIHQFVRIGAHVMIAGGALVRKDIPPYVKVGREPLAYVGINNLGLKRRGFSKEKIATIESVYDYIFLKGLNYSDAIRQIKEKIPTSFERDYITDFINHSQRGIMKRFFEKTIPKVGSVSE